MITLRLICCQSPCTPLFTLLLYTFFIINNLFFRNASGDNDVIYYVYYIQICASTSIA